MSESDMDRIFKMLAYLERCAAEQKVYNEAQKQNIERFWQKDWKDLINRIDKVADEQVRVEHRLHQLEIRMSPLPERVARTEGRVDALDKRLVGISMSIIVVGAAALGNLGMRAAAFLGG